MNKEANPSPSKQHVGSRMIKGLKRVLSQARVALTEPSTFNCSP